ncbi:MAG: helix-turn-helix transcriptional regulator, partial [Oenococcus sp.]
MLKDDGKQLNKSGIDRQPFAERLTKLRKDNHLSRKKLYQAMDEITRSADYPNDVIGYQNALNNGAKNMIWNYENGRSLPTIAKLNKLADILDVSPFYLLYGFKFLDYFYDKFIAKVSETEIVLSRKNEYSSDKYIPDVYIRFADVSRNLREYLFKSSVQSYQELAYGEGLYTKDRKKISLQEASLIFANLFKKVTGFNDFIKAPFLATDHKDILPAQLFNIDFSKKAKTQKNIKQRNLSFEYDFSISLD